MSTAPVLDAVVIGGGIAGLVVAAELARAGQSVALVESAAVTGGMLAGAEVAGVRVDVGAEAFATRTDAVPRLIADFGLELEWEQPNPAGASLLTMSGGRQRHAPLPKRTVVGLPAHPFAADLRQAVGLGGSLRAACEPLLPKRADEAGLTLRELAVRRFGARVADQVVDTIARGVYSAPASQLTLTQVAPQLATAYASSRSLSAAVRKVAQPTRTGSAVASIRGGMWRLAAALDADARAHGAHLFTDIQIAGLTRTDDGYLVTLSTGVELPARRLVLAAGPAQAADAIATLAPEHAARFVASDPASVALCTVSVDAAELDRFPVGTGVLVSQQAEGLAKALTHSNAKWAWLRAELPAHRHVLRMSSREADDSWMREPATVAAELSRLTGVRIRPDQLLSIRITHWPQAATATRVSGDPARSAAIAALAADGIELAGAWIAGTGLASVIPQAREVAARIQITPASSAAALTPERTGS